MKITLVMMKLNSNEAASEGQPQQKTRLVEALLMGIQPSPQQDFSDFQQPILSTHPRAYDKNAD